MIGCSIAMAAGRAGDVVRGFDEDPTVLDEAAARTGLEAAPSMEESVRDGAVVFEQEVVKSHETPRGEIILHAQQAPSAIAAPSESEYQSAMSAVRPATND